MKTQPSATVLRAFSAFLLIVIWILLIRMVVRTDVREIGLLGFLSGVAFLIFSMQWALQLLPGPKSRKARMHLSYSKR